MTFCQHNHNLKLPSPPVNACSAISTFALSSSPFPTASAPFPRNRKCLMKSLSPSRSTASLGRGATLWKASLHAWSGCSSSRESSTFFMKRTRGLSRSANSITCHKPITTPQNMNLCSQCLIETCLAFCASGLWDPLLHMYVNHHIDNWCQAVKMTLCSCQSNSSLASPNRCLYSNNKVFFPQTLPIMVYSKVINRHGIIRDNVS